MSHTLIVRSVAEKDIWKSAEYYEEQVVGLGKEFIMCVDAAMNSIERTPHIYPPHYKSYRRILIRRFPFGVFYIVDDKVVSVIKVFNLKQSPNSLLESLR